MNIAQPSTINKFSTPPTMETYRNAAFLAMVVQRMEAGRATWQLPKQIAANIATEQRALASAIMEPALIDIASSALLKAQQTIHANPRYQSIPEQAHESMRQIMYRRAAEANHFADLLSQPHYVTTLATMPISEANARMPRLHDVKMNEVLADLLHLENGTPQVIAHIEATAKGAMLEHDALAIVFAPNGTLHDALMRGLTGQLPNKTQAEIHHITSEWLSDRRAAAQITSDLSANDGAAYLEAIRRSTEWYRQRHDSTPSNIIQAESTRLPSTPVEREKEKTENQRAEDIAYTINHALSCGATDVFLQPTIAALFGANIGCGDSSHHRHHHNHQKPKLTLKTFAHEAGHYLKGEIIGDFIAVPLTIGVQRLFPNFMNALRQLVEPLFGWAFRRGANRAARNWAKQEGLATDAPEVATHAEQIYQHEASHLSQAVVWNMFAYPIGAVAQKVGGHGRSYPEIFKSKLVGALVSNGILIGGRMIAPSAAQKWDAMTGDKIFRPVSKTFGKLFRVDERTMERAADKQQNHEIPIWTKRVEGTQSLHNASTTDNFRQ